MSESFPFENFGLSRFSESYGGLDHTHVRELKYQISNTTSDFVKNILDNHLKNIQKQEKIESTIVEISSILNHVSLGTIRDTLRVCDGNKEDTINMLLNNISVGSISNYKHPEMKRLAALESTYISKWKYLTKVRGMNNQILESSSSSESSSVGNAREHINFLKDQRLAREQAKIQKAMEEEEKRKRMRFYCKGEKQLLKAKKYQTYKMKRSNEFYLSAEEYHFRIPESQFHRWMQTGSVGHNGQHYQITEVEYIVNPKIMDSFEETRVKLAKKHDWPITSMKPVILFHGTSKTNMDNIVKTNFLVKKIGSTTDMGWYGKGFYFSEWPGLSISYSRQNNQLLVCLVLVGKPYKQVTVQTGCAKQKGYDSHVSGDGTEVVIFDPEQICPCYRITFRNGYN